MGQRRIAPGAALSGIVLALSVAEAQAGCPSGAAVLVSCDVKGGAKRLETCLAGEHVLYRFGPKGRTPELELLRDVRAVDMTPWLGVSRTIWEEFTVFNAGVGYQVYYAQERDPGDPEVRGGVTVMRGETVLAELACDAGTVETSGYALPLFDAKEAAGQCWDFQSHSWRTC